MIDPEHLAAVLEFARRKTGTPLGEKQPDDAPAGLVSFGAAMAPLRARHQKSLTGLAAWCLEAGRPGDLDTAALCLEAIARNGGDGGMRLTRPEVQGILWADVRNLAGSLGTLWPEDLPIHLWSVLSWMDATGRFTPESDPLPALLEPLQCYGGLGPDGFPLPDGVDVDFPCQCYVPHDPTLPPGQHQHIVGRDRQTYRELIVRARLVARSDDPGVSNLEPLFRLARHMRARRRALQLHADECTYIGRIDGARSVPELWLYRYDPESRRGFDDLVLDAEGNVWVPKADRRRKAGFRWTPVDPWQGLRRAGVSPAPPEPEVSAW